MPLTSSSTESSKLRPRTRLGCWPGVSASEVGGVGTALKVVNLEQPEESLILKKPISSAESEGVVGSNTLPHGGGIRFEKDSPEYNTILNWIRGAKP